MAGTVRLTGVEAASVGTAAGLDAGDAGAAAVSDGGAVEIWPAAGTVPTMPLGPGGGGDWER